MMSMTQAHNLKEHKWEQSLGILRVHEECLKDHM